ncbi:MAG TPA: protein translocase subunit SecD [Caulobacterales bacterium]|nr:protein translocase subunit SecD [Caulobacterales bacterium]
MLHFPRWRSILVLIVTVWGALFTLPNFLPPNLRSQIPPFLPHQTLNLGLDLRGGSYLLLQVDVESLRRQELDRVADSMANALRRASPAINFTGRGVVADAARVRLLNVADAPRALQALRTINDQVKNGGDSLVFTQTPDGVVEARITDPRMRELSRSAAEQAINVVRRRVDPTGAAEVSIVRQGDNRIVVQAPGVSDPETLKERIGKTALLTFHMVDDSATPEELQAGRIPPGAMLVQPYPEIGREAEIVRRRPDLTGEHLNRAAPRFDQNRGEWVLSFEYDSVGQHIFCRLTTENTGKRFAILLDNQVLTAPRINEPICGGGGQIEGSFTPESASELAIMLNAGALPAPLTVIEQQTVGPGLGQEAIEAGTKAGIYASIAVILFMVLAYGLFGVFACLALVINVAMITAAMSVSGATLSLPGIAGLVLTIGMAVDANVLIYERMRDEQANGRGPAMALDAGFNRALITIIDSHLTQIGVALILFEFGHGPVRGFAWTLSIGVITSVITATVVTQFFIAVWFRVVRPKQLPI